MKEEFRDDKQVTPNTNPTLPQMRKTSVTILAASPILPIVEHKQVHQLRTMCKLRLQLFTSFLRYTVVHFVLCDPLTECQSLFGQTF